MKITISWQQAITEFVIIVFGVLAALAVDQWWEERRDRATEAEYLVRLHADLGDDVDEFARLDEIFAIKARIIGDLRDLKPEELLARDHTVLLDEIVFSSFSSLPAVQATSFDELMSTGRLALIESLELREALSSYYTRYKLLSAILSERHGDYLRLYPGSFPGELLYDWRVYRKLNDPDKLRQGLEAIMSRPDLTTAANAEITYAGSLVYYVRDFRKEVEQILPLFDGGVE